MVLEKISLPRRYSTVNNVAASIMTANSPVLISFLMVIRYWSSRMMNASGKLFLTLGRALTASSLVL